MSEKAKHHVARHHVTRIHRELVYWVKITGATALSAILVGNIIASQSISPLYFGLAQENRESAVHFLKSIKALPDYSKMLAAQEEAFGRGIEDEVNSPYLRLERLKHTLKVHQEKQPHDPQLLYALYQVSTQQGNTEEAAGYLKQAIALDPLIGSH